MSLYLINGPSGSGKTTIGNELKKRGFTVIDTDEEFGYYANLESEQPVVFPGDSVTKEWYKINGWIWDKSKVQKTINDASETTFFAEEH